MRLDTLNDIAWHDAEILDIHIDRSDAGHSDTIAIVVRWADWKPTPEEGISIVEFSNCYAIDMELNFGVIAAESISRVWLDSGHPKLSKIRDYFKVEDLACVTIETNSTSSLIKILATSVQIVPYLPPLIES